MDKELNKRKCGIIIAMFPIFTIFIMVILFGIFLLYTQVISTILSIKTDVFYILKNALISFDSYDLAYEEYSIDKTKLRETIRVILDNNYISENSLIKLVEIKELSFYNNQNAYEHTNGRYNVPIIHIKLEVKFNPVIKLINTSEGFSILIHEDVKLTLLEYGGN